MKTHFPRVALLSLLVVAGAVAPVVAVDDIEAATNSLSATEGLRTAPISKAAVGRWLDALAASSSAEERAGLAALLARGASASDVERLETLANNPATAEAARRVLEAIPGAQADAALVRLLEANDQRIATGAAMSLGARGTTSALEALATAARSSDDELASASMLAIGAFGTPPAFETLQAMPMAERPGVRRAHQQAMIAAALGAGHERAATAMGELSRSGATEAIRGQALVAWARLAPHDAQQAVLDALASDDRHRRRMAVPALGHIATTAVADRAAGLLPTMDSDTQAGVLGALGGTGSEKLQAAALGVLQHSGATNAAAVVRYFATEDGPTALVVLLAVATLGENELGEQAVVALGQLRDPRIDGEVARLLAAGAAATGPSSEPFGYAALTGFDAADRHARALLPSLCRTAAARRLATTIPTLFEVAKGSDRGARAAALDSLGELAEKTHLPALMDLAATLPANARRGAIDALVACSRRSGPEAVMAEVRRRFEAATKDADRELWLGVAGRLGGEEALALVMAATASPTKDLRRAALRSLANWPDVQAIDPLLGLVASSADKAEATLATRSVLGILNQLPPDDDRHVLPALQRLAPLVAEAESRRGLLALLPRTRSLDAATLALPLLDDNEVATEAALAIAQLGVTCHADQPDAAVAMMMAALDRVEPSGEPRAALIRTARAVLPVWAAEQWVGDPFTGCWQGSLTYQGATMPAVALVVPRDFGEYAVQLREQFDGPHKLLAILEGRSNNDTLSISGWDWVGTIHGDAMTAAIPDTTDSHFAFQRVVRSSPTMGREAPAGAIMLFDGSSFSEWTGEGDGGAVTWTIVDGVAQVAPKQGSITTRRAFTDYELHLEFRAPYAPGNPHQMNGNSGVFLGMAYEVQVLASFGLDPRPDDCGAFYNIAPPAVNACAPPLQWQTYDIVYRAPRVAADGSLAEPARATVVHNGVTIHDDRALTRTSFENVPHPSSPRPLLLQDHHNRVQYRHIWLRELSPDDNHHSAVGRILTPET